MKLRRNVPNVDGARTAWPSTAAVAPARNMSASSIESPPANAEWTRVIALSPTLARPALSPKSIWVSNSSRKPRAKKDTHSDDGATHPATSGGLILDARKPTRSIVLVPQRLWNQICPT